ncbi:hypothetical protein [Flavobacterium facile]|uniref:hypothetical protein n=1 Tax=Flavobacterium facile TaxID=2893174 RepID=UPI002E75F7BE|nr:hypothetical protein [Flavobacterium sp. T-12]
MSKDNGLYFVGGRSVVKTNFINEIKKSFENGILEVDTSHGKTVIEVNFDIQLPKGDNFYIKDGFLLQSIESKEIR